MSLRMSLSVCKNEYRYVVIRTPKTGAPPDATLSYPLASNHRLSASQIVISISASYSFRSAPPRHECLRLHKALSRQSPTPIQDQAIEDAAGRRQQDRKRRWHMPVPSKTP